MVLAGVGFLAHGRWLPCARWTPVPCHRARDNFLVDLQARQQRSGAALLQALVQECSSRRLLQGLGTWGAKLLAVLRAARGDATQVAALAALESLFWRAHQLLDLPGMRQEGASLAGKLMVYLRPFLQQDGGQ